MDSGSCYAYGYEITFEYNAQRWVCVGQWWELHRNIDWNRQELLMPSKAIPVDL